MTEPKDLLLVNEQLRQSIRFWRVLALTACVLLVLIAAFGVIRAERERMRAMAAMREAHAALARAQDAVTHARQR
jgi:hypothetical protein